MRKLVDSVKQKADGDEIDSLNTLLNELYERFTEFERTGASNNGGDAPAS